MSAQATLERLEALDITVALDGDRVKLAPASKVPSALLAMVQEDKWEIIALLAGPVEAPVVSDEQRLLHSRLRMGLTWLIDLDATLKAGGIIDGPDAEKWGRGLVRWGELETELRDSFGYTACVLGPTEHCPPDSPVLCAACARGDDETGWKEQG